MSPKISSDFGTSAGADAKSGQVSDDVKREVSSFRKFISKVFPKKRAKRFKNGQLPPGGTVRVMVDTLVIAEVRPIKSKLAQLGLAKENKVKKEVIYHHLHLDPTYELIDISMLLAEKRGGFGQSLRVRVIFCFRANFLAFSSLSLADAVSIRPFTPLLYIATPSRSSSILSSPSAENRLLLPRRILGDGCELPAVPPREPHAGGPSYDALQPPA